MKLLPAGIVLVLLALLSVPCIGAQSNRQQKKDSLRRVIARTEGAERRLARQELARIYLIEVRKEGAIDTLLTLYDAIEADARQQGDVAVEGTAKANRIGAYASKSLFGKVIDEAPAVLEFLSANGLWKDYYQTSMQLADAYRRTGDFDRGLQEAERFYAHAKTRGDRAGMGMAQLTLSRIYSGQRRFSDAETCLRECIGLLEDERPYLNYLATAYNNLATNLIGQQRYDEALEAARATEEVNRRYEEASHTPQPSAWGNLWVTYTDIYRQTGQYDLAQRCIDRVDSLSRGALKMYKERGHVLYGQKRYREALEMLDRAAEASPGNLEVKSLKLMTLAQLQEADKAVELFSEVIGDLEKNYNEAFASRLDEVRTQYEVDKYAAEKERNRNYFLFALGGCVLLALLLGATFYYNRIITHKNRGLYRQIREQDHLEEQLARITREYETAVPAGKPSDDAVSQPVLPGSRSQRELVRQLREYLLADNHLADADTGREAISAVLGSNRSTLTEAVKAVTGKTPMEYIRQLQVEEARRLLDNHPELTVEAVAYNCGFNIPSTFYRLFRKQYGISPAEYRKIAGSSDR